MSRSNKWTINKYNLQFQCKLIKPVKRYLKYVLFYHSPDTGFLKVLREQTIKSSLYNLYFFKGQCTGFTWFENYAVTLNVNSVWFFQNTCLDDLICSSKGTIDSPRQKKLCSKQRHWNDVWRVPRSNDKITLMPL